MTKNRKTRADQRGHRSDRGIETVDPTDPDMPKWLRLRLRELYDEALNEPLPEDIEHLLRRLDESERSQKKSDS